MSDNMKLTNEEMEEIIKRITQLEYSMYKSKNVSCYRYARFFLNKKVNEILDKHFFALRQELIDNGFRACVSISLDPQEGAFETLGLPPLETQPPNEIYRWDTHTKSVRKISDENIHAELQEPRQKDECKQELHNLGLARKKKLENHKNLQFLHNSFFHAITKFFKNQEQRRKK